MYKATNENVTESAHFPFPVVANEVNGTEYWFQQRDK
jgi:hypothetical protein